MMVSRTIGAAAIASAALSHAAFATGTNHLGITQVDGTPLEKVTYQVPSINDPTGAPGKTSVTVGAAAPVQTAISPSPNDIWVKNFQWDIANRGLVPGDLINLYECFEINLNEDGTVPRDIPITDWHEHLTLTTTAPINGSLQFIEGFIEFDFGAGLVTPNPLMVGGGTNGEIWFDWAGSDLGGVNATDGEFNSVLVKIHKTIEYQGNGLDAGVLDFLEFQIIEYPTPTPGTLAPLAMMGLMMRRRR